MTSQERGALHPGGLHRGYRTGARLPLWFVVESVCFRCCSLSIATFFPERATVAPGNNRDKEHLMLDVVMLALGLGFFLAAVGYAHASEEDENDPRLFTRRPRRCRLAVFLDVRPASA